MGWGGERKIERRAYSSEANPFTGYIDNKGDRKHRWGWLGKSQVKYRVSRDMKEVKEKIGPGRGNRRYLSKPGASLVYSKNSRETVWLEGNKGGESEW